MASIRAEWLLPHWKGANTLQLVRASPSLSLSALPLRGDSSTLAQSWIRCHWHLFQPCSITGHLLCGGQRAKALGIQGQPLTDCESCRGWWSLPLNNMGLLAPSDSTDLTLHLKNIPAACSSHTPPDEQKRTQNGCSASYRNSDANFLEFDSLL